MKTPDFFKPFVDAGKQFVEDDVPQAAAALSFYAITALPPLVVILLSIIGMVYADGSAVQQLSEQVSRLLGPSAAEMISTIVEHRSSGGHGLAALVGATVLLVSASGFFAQLQKALNQAWRVRPKPSTGILLTLKKRLLSMTAVLGTGFLLVISLVLSTVISAAGQMLEEWLGIGTVVSTVGQELVSLLVIFGLFALIFKYLPDAVIGWQDVWKGALATAFIFLIGKFALGWYLGRADFAAGYGSAGALVVVLFWVYFSSMILLYGAELTQVQTRAEGRRIEPESHAERLEERTVSEEREQPEKTAA